MPRLCPQPHGSFAKPRQYLRSNGPPNNTSTKTSSTPVAAIGHAADQGKQPCAGGAGQAIGAAANILPHDHGCAKQAAQGGGRLSVCVKIAKPDSGADADLGNVSHDRRSKIYGRAPAISSTQP
jgi:hypothetical protein